MSGLNDDARNNLHYTYANTEEKTNKNKITNVAFSCEIIQAEIIIIITDAINVKQYIGT